jgi:hypothetical protein
MPALTVNSRSPYNPNDEVHIPFKAVYRVVPIQDGRRWTTIRDLEKMADFIEYDLTQAGFNIAIPVRAIPQFGGKTARIEITGFTTKVTVEQHPITKPTSAVNRMSTGVVPGEHTGTVSGDPGGGNLAESQEPTARTENDVLGLKLALDAASTTIGTRLTLENMDYNGIKYGRGARTFPD